MKTRFPKLTTVLSLLILMSCSDESFLRFASESPLKIRLVETTTPKVYNLQIGVPRDVTQLYYCVNAAAGTCTTATAKENFAIAQGLPAPTTNRLVFSATQTISLENTQLTIVAQNAASITRQLAFETSSGADTGLLLMKKETMQEELTYITDDKFKGRLSATEGNVQVADWLIEHLKKLGIAPGGPNGNYRQDFTMINGPASGEKSSNIIGILPGNDPVLKDEYVIIGAHMDHAGTLSYGYTCSQGSIKGDSICNGADDNGSGTISVLNIAKALAAVRNDLKRSVIIMWFSGEEEGLEGSKYYVKNPIYPLAKTVYMINLDMVGYMSSYNNSLDALGGGTADHGVKVINDIKKRYTNKINITKKTDGGSDHAPFFNKRIPGVFYHTGVSNNKNYHRTSDHPDKIDYDGMLMAAKVAFETGYRMAIDPEASNMSSSNYGGTEPFVTDEELKRSCHDLISSSYTQKIESLMMSGTYDEL